MKSSLDIMMNHRIVPYIRECDFALRKPWVLPERRLLDYLLIYVQEGECLFTVDGVSYPFQKGEFCFIQPNSVNRLEGVTNTVTPFAHFDIFYRSSSDQSFPTRAGQLDLTAYQHLMQPRLDELFQIKIPVKLKLSHLSKFRDMFLQVVEFWQYRDPIMQLKAQTRMMELVTFILEDYFPANHVKQMSPQALNWITSYFSFNLSEPLSVADMARRANLSTSRFNDVFKMQYGMTPHQYLLKTRIDHACELLLTSKLTQEQIASYCGFSDIHHFSKAFKKKLGMSPGEYSRGLRADEARF